MLSVFLLFFFAAPSHTVDLIKRVSESGRVVEIATPLSDRVQPPPSIAPGAPPLLSFRLFEGQSRRRYSGLDLVMDDAGH